MKLKTTTDTLTGKPFRYNCTSMYPVDGYDWIVPARLGANMDYLDPARTPPHLLASLNDGKTYPVSSYQLVTRDGGTLGSVCAKSEQAAMKIARQFFGDTIVRVSKMPDSPLSDQSTTTA